MLPCLPHILLLNPKAYCISLYLVAVTAKVESEYVFAESVSFHSSSPTDRQYPLEYAYGVVGGVLSVLCP